MSNKSVTSKKIFLRTFGCQMNNRDSEVICGLLLEAGYKLTEDEKEADIVMFNTCSVRQHAEDRVWSEIGRLSKVKSVEGKPIIGLIGCMAQNYKEKIFERAPNVDFVVGPSDISKIPGMLKIIQGRRERDCFALPTAGLAMTGDLKIWETDGNIRPEEIYHTGFYQDKGHAYVVISEGCSNYCSYCVVPYVRGKLHNRDYKNILKEIQEAVDKGITKITLLGQNVCAYGAETREKINFIKLLELVNQVKGLEEFSFITSHPKDASADLFKAIAGLGKLRKFLHLPVQSGSNRILKLMNRGYTKEHYLDLTDRYKQLNPGGDLSTDIIVGFPTETEEDFLETYGLMKEIRFNSAYIFKYSPRPNTEAARFLDDVPRKEKERRHKILLDYQKDLWCNSKQTNATVK